MVTPNIERRYNKPLGIQRKIHKKLTEVLGKEAVARYKEPTLEDQGKRCGMYHENYKTKKNKLSNKIKTVCDKCKHAVCGKDTVVTCQKYYEENAWKNNIIKCQSTLKMQKTFKKIR